MLILSQKPLLFQGMWAKSTSPSILISGYPTAHCASRNACHRVCVMDFLAAAIMTLTS